MSYSSGQIQGAKFRFQLNGIGTVSDAQAVDFLDWYFATRTVLHSDVHAIAAAISNSAQFRAAEVEKMREIFQRK